MIDEPASSLTAAAEVSPAYALIVDDDSDMVLMLSEFVQGCGLLSAGAQSFAQFQKTAQVLPCVLLLDLVMPDDCSEDVVAWMAEHAAHVPIVLVSSLALDAIERRRDHAVALGLQVPAMLRKPFWPHDVAKALQIAGVHDKR